MTLEIDIDKLKQRRTELEAELAQVSGLITLAEQFSKVSAIQYIAPPQPSPQLPSNGNHAQDAPKRGFTAGLRRAVIMGLHTGPATETDLARALAWPLPRTRTVVSSMLKFKICYLGEHGRLALSEEGKRQAGWYLAHPDRLTYSPGKG